MKQLASETSREKAVGCPRRVRFRCHVSDRDDDEFGAPQTDQVIVFAESGGFLKPCIHEIWGIPPWPLLGSPPYTIF